MKERLQVYARQPVFASLQAEVARCVRQLHHQVDEARHEGSLCENTLLDLGALTLRAERLSLTLDGEERRVRDFINCSIEMFREYRRFFYDMSQFKESILEPSNDTPVSPAPVKRTTTVSRECEYDSPDESPPLVQQQPAEGEDAEEEDELGDMRLPLIQIRRELASLQQSTKRPQEKMAVVPRESALNTVLSNMTHMAVRCENGMLIESWRQEQRQIDGDRALERELERLALESRYERHLAEMERHMLCYWSLCESVYGEEAEATIDALRQQGVLLEDEMLEPVLALAATFVTLRQLMDAQRENLRDYAMNCAAKFSECATAYSGLAMALREAAFLRAVRTGSCVEPRLRGMYPYVKHVEQ